MHHRRVRGEMTLRRLTKESCAATIEDANSIDFGSVGLYVVGIQFIASATLSALTIVVSTWLIPQSANSALRTLVVSAAVSVALTRSPLRVGNVRGTVTLYMTLRPALGIYLLSVACEQLLHSCSADPSSVLTQSTESMLFSALSAVLICASFARANTPCSESDRPFILSVCCGAIAALFPPRAILGSGPLCRIDSLLDGCERVLRASTFMLLYSTHAYAAAPRPHDTHELYIVVLKTSAASVWVLFAHLWTLPVVLLQLILIVYKRIATSSYREPSIQYTDKLSLTGNVTPSTDVECGEPVDIREYLRGDEVDDLLETHNTNQRLDIKRAVVPTGYVNTLKFNLDTMTRTTINDNAPAAAALDREC